MSEPMKNNMACAETGRRRERGFSLVAAVFLVVVLSTLGAAIANFAVVQHKSSASDIQGSRAYQAARAGIEWGLYWALIGSPGSCPTGNMTPPAATLVNFTVTVGCGSYTATNLSANNLVRTLTATACNQPAAGACPNPAPGANYVQRVVTITFSAQ
jgi:MSHA biogenesis protein MshP